MVWKISKSSTIRQLEIRDELIDASTPSSLLRKSEHVAGCLDKDSQKLFVAVRPLPIGTAVWPAVPVNRTENANEERNGGEREENPAWRGRPGRRVSRSRLSVEERERERAWRQSNSNARQRHRVPRVAAHASWRLIARPRGGACLDERTHAKSRTPCRPRYRGVARARTRGDRADRPPLAGRRHADAHARFA